MPRPPPTTIDADGWLHTGDIAYIDEDGHMFIVDRLKELIKYKGFQVAPAELEAAISASRRDRRRRVGLPDPEAGEIPMAFVVRTDAARIGSDHGSPSRTLSPYKKVHRIDFVDTIPKSASGKILRRLLRDEVKARG